MRIVADEWCNTLEDVKEFTDCGGCHMVQIKTPDLGGIQHIVSVLYCRSMGWRRIWAAPATRRSSPPSAACTWRMATQPHPMLVKPGMGLDEGFMVVKNEMQRIRRGPGGTDGRRGMKEMSSSFTLGDPGLRLSRGVVSAGHGPPAAPDRVDAGCTDPGPYYLGSGKSFTDRALVKRDLAVDACAKGCASDPTWLSAPPADRGAARTWLGAGRSSLKLPAKHRSSFRLGVIHADVGQDVCAVRCSRQGRVRCRSCPTLTEAAIDESTYLVAQMGCEPLMKASRRVAR